MSEKKTIEVKLQLLASDFKDTSYESLTDCPIARAFNRKFPSKNKIEVWSRVIKQGNKMYLIKQAMYYCIAYEKYVEKAKNANPKSIIADVNIIYES